MYIRPTCVYVAVMLYVMLSMRALRALFAKPINIGTKLRKYIMLDREAYMCIYMWLLSLKLRECIFRFKRHIRNGMGISLSNKGPFHRAYHNFQYFNINFSVEGMS